MLLKHTLNTMFRNIKRIKNTVFLQIHYEIKNKKQTKRAFSFAPAGMFMQICVGVDLRSHNNMHMHTRLQLAPPIFCPTKRNQDKTASKTQTELFRWNGGWLLLSCRKIAQTLLFVVISRRYTMIQRCKL